MQKRRPVAGKPRRIEIMDTTLRDGEQAEGISMMPEEKRTIARRLLETVKVDRIEVASARVSEGEHRAVRTIVDDVESSGLTVVEILGLSTSIASDREVGAAVNLLTKGSLRHCREQSVETTSNTWTISPTVDYARHGMTTNVPEDWSGGMSLLTT